LEKKKGDEKMTIAKRTLEKWRKEAFYFIDDTKDMKEAILTTEMCNRILRLTQVLLDQHLIRR